jgi:hypothetical protein
MLSDNYWILIQFRVHEKYLVYTGDDRMEMRVSNIVWKHRMIHDYYVLYRVSNKNWRQENVLSFGRLSFEEEEDDDDHKDGSIIGRENGRHLNIWILSIIRSLTPFILHEKKMYIDLSKRDGITFFHFLSPLFKLNLSRLRNTWINEMFKIEFILTIHTQKRDKRINGRTSMTIEIDDDWLTLELNDHTYISSGSRA